MKCVKNSGRAKTTAGARLQPRVYYLSGSTRPGKTRKIPVTKLEPRASEG